MKRISSFLGRNWQTISFLLFLVAGLWFLLFWKLGSLTGGLSSIERQTAMAPYGLHNVLTHPLYLPLQALRALVFHFSTHSQFIVRLPNAIIALTAVIMFGVLLKTWHGTRTALFGSALFACNAWVLHTSRLASFDVLYLWAIPALLLTHVALQQRPNFWLSRYGSVLIWGLLLYIPGMIWLLIAEAILLRRPLRRAWRLMPKLWERSLFVFVSAIWLPLLILDLTKTAQLREWLGLPARFGSLHTVLKQFAAVPYHLLIRGPQRPEIWLGRAPLLDILMLVALAIGVYFYARHLSAARSRMLLSIVILSFILVGLHGAVHLSLLVPLLFVYITAGIAYLLRDWLKVFPLNPLARSIGIGLLGAAVIVSCTYNVRSYFVAWAHDPATTQVFSSRL